MSAQPDMAIVWWHWLVLGLLLIALELAASGGFYIIFFGIAAVVVSLMAALGAGLPVWVQLLLFSVLVGRIAAVLPQPADAVDEHRGHGRRRRLAGRRDRPSCSRTSRPAKSAASSCAAVVDGAQQRRHAPDGRAALRRGPR